MVNKLGAISSDTNMAEYNYVVDDATARLALTGMTIGQTIFQADTGVIYKATGSTTSVEVIIVPTYDYIVADDTERLALTGMTVGDTIFVTDTGSVYIADSATTSVTSIITFKASDIEVEAGVEDTKYVTSKQINDNTGYDIVSGNVLLVNLPTEDVINGGGTYVLQKEITINASGIFKVSFDMVPDSGTARGLIYINGIAVGTVRQLSSPASYTTYTEDITVNAGDEVQLYAYNTTSNNTRVKDFSLSYDLKPKKLTYSIINP